MDNQQLQPPQNDPPQQDVAGLVNRIESLEKMIQQLMAQQQQQRDDEPSPVQIGRSGRTVEQQTNAAVDLALQRQQDQPQSILDPTPAEQDKKQTEAWHEQAMRNMGLSPRRAIPQRTNPETARLNDGSRQPMPYDSFDPQTINDTAETIRQASSQTEVVSTDDRLYAALNRIAVLEQKVGVLYPPMPRGTSGDTIPGNIFAVRLTQTGGSSGSASAQCTFTYTVKSYDNTTTLGTGIGMTGNGQRTLKAVTFAGTRGLAYLDASGALVLLWADETFDQFTCAA